jgi:hypothetical protein
MSTIFLSYRRSDSPQACRVYDWLTRRFGKDDIFMDVAAIPVAVDYADYIRQRIAESEIMIVLIGSGWLDRIQAAGDPVRTEVEAAIDNRVPLMPLLIGNTPMPAPEALPPTVAAVAMQNAVTIGESHDFYTHMQLLLPKLESILRAASSHHPVMANPDVIYHACQAIVAFLKEQHAHNDAIKWHVDWRVVGTSDFDRRNEVSATLFMHRAMRLGALLELHVVLSFWGHRAANEHRLAGWVMRQLEQTPVIPDDFLADREWPSECNLKIRRSDEDPRQIWKMITTEPLRLSLAYVATVSPKQIPSGG